MENERMTEAFMDMAGRVSMELERVEGLLQTALIMLDLRLPCFDDGMLYVALSRVRTPNGLTIITN